MARRNRTSNSGNGSLLAILGFVVLIVASVFWTISALDRLTGITISGSGLGAVQLLLGIAIVVVIAMAAYPFARTRSKVWRTIYWVIVIIALAGAIFGGVATMI